MCHTVSLIQMSEYSGFYFCGGGNISDSTEETWRVVISLQSDSASALSTQLNEQTRGHLSAFYYGENTKLMSTLTDAIEQLNSLKQIVLHQ